MARGQLLNVDKRKKSVEGEDSEGGGEDHGVGPTTRAKEVEGGGPEGGAEGVVEDVVEVGVAEGEDELGGLDECGGQRPERYGGAEGEAVAEDVAEGDEEGDVAEQVIQGDEGVRIAEEIAERDPAERAGVLDARLPQAGDGDRGFSHRQKDDDRKGGGEGRDEETAGNAHLLLFVQRFALVDGLGGDEDAEVAEDAFVDGAEDGGGVDVATVELTELIEGAAGVVIRGGRHRQGDEHLVGVEARVAGAEVLGFESLDRLDRLGGEQIDMATDARQVLEGVEEHG